MIIVSRSQVKNLRTRKTDYAATDFAGVRVTPWRALHANEEEHQLEFERSLS